MNKDIDIAREAGVLKLHINRPKKKNALTRAMYQTLADAINAANNDDDTHVIYLSGTGDAFCAGNDLEDFLQNPPVSQSAPVYQFMQALANADKPVVAAVNGLAIGIGTTLLLHCDLVYASDQAKFQLPFVQLGLCAEFGSSLLLPLLCGRQRATELLLCGETFNAEQAMEIGLLAGITREEQLQSTALGRAAYIAAQPHSATVATKSLLKQALKTQLDEAIQRESKLFMTMLQQEESRQIMSKFLEK